MAKKQQSHAKRAREVALRERRERKQAKKAEVAEQRTAEAAPATDNGFGGPDADGAEAETETDVWIR
jgi:hypothetical protein